MKTSTRSAIIFSSALAICAFAPAQADPAADFAPAAVPAELPKIATPDLLAQEAEPQLSGDPVLAAEPPAPAPAPEAAPEPQVAVGGDLSDMVAQLRASDPGSRELECLATGIYFESKSEPLSGQLAVGHVIANRANSGGRFPSSYCGVLFQRGQFSFIRGKSLPSTPRAHKQWKTAVAIAKIVHQDLKESNVGKAMFFHARRVSPGWRLKRVATIGNHIFYR
jgi:N-acetylmuramoyl-L-alanine amidase